MLKTHSWPTSGLAVLAFALIAAAGCNRNDSSQSKSGIGGLLGSIASGAQQQQSAHDPCTLVSADEAAPYVGPLTVQPYRATDDNKPAVDGETCVYRGTNGRTFVITPDWTGGQMMGRVMQIPNAVGKVLAKGAPGMDTMANRISQQGIPGPWDQASFMPTGVLTAVKGQTSVIVDVSGASGQKSDAVAIATIAMGRVGHPLGYDGAKAVAMVPVPKAHPANACDLVPRAEVEAAIGPLSAAPVPDSTGDGCTYQVSTPEGSRTYPVAFTWTGGGHSYNVMKHMMSTVGGMLGAPSSTPMDTMKPTGNMGAMMGAMMKMATSAGQPHSNAPSPLDTMKPTAANLQKAMAMANKPTTAPGAVTTVGFTTDTTLQGPWDNASLLHGTQLLAVRNDVMVAMTLETADYNKAKALLATICTHL
ncbi:MAG TPA: hypothetical protein VJO52_15925 [Gemmatimonadaceae bacterium]|nr:hypothetical protein [Gemmatimonadaceae bacterium]